MEDERRRLKEWLRGLLPEEEMSRKDVAYELGVTRKTISNMLNPGLTGFGNGLTMLRYLRLVGGLRDAPEASISRLQSLEAEIVRLGDRTAEGLEAIEARLSRIEDQLSGRGGRRTAPR